jgi:hypothetical protein
VSEQLFAGMAAFSKLVWTFVELLLIDMHERTESYGDSIATNLGEHGPDANGTFELGPNDCARDKGALTE